MIPFNSNIETIKKYIYFKNGAMYSFLILGLMMMCEAFGIHLPQWGAPLVTILILIAAVVKSRVHMKGV